MPKDGAIVQLASSQFCACAGAWKSAFCPLHRPARRDSKGGLTLSSVVYEGHEVHSAAHSSSTRFQLSSDACCSLDGRHLFVFTDKRDLLLVDLFRNTHKCVLFPHAFYVFVC